MDALFLCSDMGQAEEALGDSLAALVGGRPTSPHLHPGRFYKVGQG